jgi:ATP-dependent DNA ligase
MHKHTKDIKNRLIAHTVMVWKGEVLAGKTWGYARSLLETCTYGKHVVISELFKTGFWDLFQAADGVNVEGIVLKDPKGLLKFSATLLPDVPFMLKIRKPCKKYNF